MRLTIKNSDIRKAINEVISSQKAQKLIKEAMYRNMPGEGEDFPSFNGRKPKTVKARINQIYSLVNKYGLSTRKYTDDHWQATDDYDRILTHLGYEVHWDVKNGGYGDYRDGMPMSKTYDITLVAEDGMEIEGYIKCMAAGSVEDPFDAYDTCMVLWNKPKRTYNEAINKLDLRSIIKETIKDRLNESEMMIADFDGDENLKEYAYNAAMDLANRTDEWIIAPTGCGDNLATEGEDGLALKENMPDGQELSIDCEFGYNVVYYETTGDFEEEDYYVDKITVSVDGDKGYCFFSLDKNDPLYKVLCDKIEFSPGNLEDYPYYSADDQWRDEREAAELDRWECARDDY